MNLCIEQYKKAKAVASRYMVRYGKSMLNAKDAHDIAIESLFEKKINKYVVIRNIIDEARSEMGRTDRLNADGKPRTGRKFRNIDNCKLITEDPVPEAIKNEALTDLSIDLPKLKPQVQQVAMLLAQGYQGKDIAEKLNVTPARISQLVNQLRDVLKNNSEWNQKIKSHQRKSND